jgi:hypothetical protein
MQSLQKILPQQLVEYGLVINPLKLLIIIPFLIGHKLSFSTYFNIN